VRAEERREERRGLAGTLLARVWPTAALATDDAQIEREGEER